MIFEKIFFLNSDTSSFLIADSVTNYLWQNEDNKKTKLM